MHLIQAVLAELLSRMVVKYFESTLEYESVILWIGEAGPFVRTLWTRTGRTCSANVASDWRIDAN